MHAFARLPTSLVFPIFAFRFARFVVYIELSQTGRAKGKIRVIIAVLYYTNSTKNIAIHENRMFS